MEAVFFDLDGLLLDSEKIYVRFWREAAEQLNYHVPYAEILKLRSCDAGLARQVITEATNDADAYQKIRALRKSLMAAYLEKETIALKDGAIELLDTLQAKRIKKVIVTSSDPDEKRPMLQAYGIDQFFDDIISVKNVQRGKPFPDMYVYACECLHLEPTKCIALEDSPNGVMSAWGAGINVIMVPDLSEPDDALRAKCKIVRSLRDVITML